MNRTAGVLGLAGVLLLAVVGCSTPWVSKRPAGPSLALNPEQAPRSPMAPVVEKPSPWERFKALFLPEKKTRPAGSPSDSISLSKKPKPNPELLTALGRLHEQARNPKAAEKQYLAALKLDANYVPAHLALARLYDRQNRFPLAVKHYQQAAALEPNKASYRNDLGVCLARAGQMQQAAQALGEAVRLNPREVRYRNNLATVLVHLGRPQEALKHLQAVHPPDVAAYNLGYLLAQAGQAQQAAGYFQMALRANPQMQAARQWLAHLEQMPRSVAQQPNPAPRYGQPVSPAAPARPR